MRRLSPEHMLLILGFALAVLGQLQASGDGWHHVSTIDFWMFTTAQLGFLVRGIYTNKPQRPPQNTDEG